MNKALVVLDTSAIISLGCSEKFQYVNGIFNLNSPMRVMDELVDISETEDKIGIIAKNILDRKFIAFHTLPKNLKNIKGEIEVAHLAYQLKAEAIVMDDIKCMRKLELITKIPVWFSSYIIYALCQKKVLSYKEGWSAIEKMKIGREWKDNLIVDYAKILFEKTINENRQ